MTECGVRIWGRKYLNECMPFPGVRQSNEHGLFHKAREISNGGVYCKVPNWQFIGISGMVITLPFLNHSD